MKCIICHGDQIEPREVSEEFPAGQDIVCFSVTVPVCRTCGERYYDRETLRLLEEMEEKVRLGSAPLREVEKFLPAPEQVSRVTILSDADAVF